MYPHKYLSKWNSKGETKKKADTRMIAEEKYVGHEEEMSLTRTNYISKFLTLMTPQIASTPSLD